MASCFLHHKTSIWRNDGKALHVLWMCSRYCQTVLKGLSPIHPKQMHCFCLTNSNNSFLATLFMVPGIIAKYYTEENFNFIIIFCVAAAHTGKLRMREEWAVLQGKQKLILMSHSPSTLFKVRLKCHCPFAIHYVVLMALINTFSILV